MRSDEPITRDCLVAVINNDSDMHRFADERWYRIPERAIGRALTAQALRETQVVAAYQTTSVRDGLPGAVEVWGEIIERRVLTRREIIPEEPDHPAAAERYHLLRLESIHRLDAPIVSRRPRRMLFLRTTLSHLLHATDLNELVIGTRAEELLWQSLRAGVDAGNVERRYYLRMGGVVMEVDFALFKSEQAVGIICRDDHEPGVGMVAERESYHVPNAWLLLHFSAARLESDMDGCMRELTAIIGEDRRERTEDRG